MSGYALLNWYDDRCVQYYYCSHTHSRYHSSVLCGRYVRYVTFFHFPTHFAPSARQSVGLSIRNSKLCYCSRQTMQHCHLPCGSSINAPPSSHPSQPLPYHTPSYITPAKYAGVVKCRMSLGFRTLQLKFMLPPKKLEMHSKRMFIRLSMVV
jgi:hypothetical protein